MKRRFVHTIIGVILIGSALAPSLAGAAVAVPHAAPVRQPAPAAAALPRTGPAFQVTGMPYPGLGFYYGGAAMQLATNGIFSAGRSSPSTGARRSPARCC